MRPWRDILDATKERDGFVQYSYALYTFKGSEDSLYLNIHTPKVGYINLNHTQLLLMYQYISNIIQITDNIAKIGNLIMSEFHQYGRIIRDI